MHRLHWIGYLPVEEARSFEQLVPHLFTHHDVVRYLHTAVKLHQHYLPR